MKLVHEFKDGDFEVKLFVKKIKKGGDYTDFRYTVIYGAQSFCDLPYNDAMKRYGFCVGHSLACAGKFDSL